MDSCWTRGGLGSREPDFSPRGQHGIIFMQDISLREGNAVRVKPMNVGEGDLAMWWLKSCPKCGGDVVEVKDPWASGLKCFQCGRELTALEAAAVRARGSRQRPAAIHAKGGGSSASGEEYGDSAGHLSASA